MYTHTHTYTHTQLVACWGSKYYFPRKGRCMEDFLHLTC